jgi:signal peptide peptidase SppA
MKRVTLNADSFPIDEPLAMEPEAIGRTFDWGPNNQDAYETADGIATISIDGPLSRTGGYWHDGYVSIVSRFKAALADPAVEAVVFAISSPGGTVSGLFDAVAELRAAKKEAGKPIIAHTGDGAYSAAYALSTIADKFFVGAHAGAGSIGVIATIASYAKQNEQNGVDIRIVESGKLKSDLHPDKPIDPEAIKRAQARVDDLALAFAELVASSRKMTAKQVLSLEAGTFYGEKAVSAGLADGVKTLVQAVEVAAAQAKKNREKQGMKMILGSLGLPEAATEQDAVAAINADKGTLAELKTMFGVKSVGELVGTLRAVKETAEQAESALKNLEAEKAKARKAELQTVMEAAEKEGRLLPSERDHFIEQATFAHESTVAYLRKKPAVINLGTASANKEPEGYSGKPYAEMSNKERVELRKDNPELFKQLRAEFRGDKLDGNTNKRYLHS